ncbi:MAG TPA: DNA photolyase [Gammaproteobacteria bacterium]|nr:DNA photolyase [Gammaproteobacteria bacterium]
MPRSAPYSTRFPSLVKQTLFHRLPDEQQAIIESIAGEYRFTHQDLRQICEIALDLHLWEEPDIEQVWPDPSSSPRTGKALRQALIQQVVQYWEDAKSRPNCYPLNGPQERISAAAKPVEKLKGKLGLGYCPVASPKTLCCNLMTLDAVDNCGFGCTYCSIQSFYDGKEISFDQDFANKLAQLEIDPDKTYHIGTGQSSDSLMWGNSHGVLDALLDFARRYPNVILELKTKSANISHLLKSELPRNILCTWSLNTETIINNEEHGTASLEKRLAAARAIADKGGIVGFHFHPMVHYEQWEADYQQVIKAVTTKFKPEEVALVSLGTLTFIKPVIRDIRERGISTKILKMPLLDAEGKLSYPDDIKIALFSHAWNCFPESWRQQVFFYLCMEHQRFWEPVFGFNYKDNQAFETAMKKAYLQKISVTST